GAAIPASFSRSLSPCALPASHVYPRHPMALAQAQLLQDYLRAVRRVALRRAALTLALDLALFWCAWTLLVVVLVGWTLRGDLGANLGFTLVLLGTAALLSARIRSLQSWISGPVALA